MTDIQVIDNQAEHRYEALLDGTVAGFAEYRLGNSTITFTHTIVEPEFEGKGIGGALARGALDDVRRQGNRQVVPRCPFIKAWIERHPDYQDLVNGASPSAGL